MNLTFEERVKACAIAAALVEREASRFTPDKPAARSKDAFVTVAEHVFRGSSGDEIVLQIKLQWGYLIAGSIWRDPVPVHARYKVLFTPEGRRLKLVSLHVPTWEKDQSGDRHMCLTCGPDFTKHDVIVQDTNLHEF